MAVIFLVAIAILSPLTSFAGDMFKFNVSGETPASFFSPGAKGYFFPAEELEAIGCSALILNGIGEKDGLVALEEIFSVNPSDNGTAALFPKIQSPSCPQAGRSEENCLYSNPVVTEIEVKNLTGKINGKEAGRHLKKERPRDLNFGVGSKLYGLKIAASAYDFNSFTDFASLKCISSEDGGCALFSDSVSLMGFLPEETDNGTKFVKQAEDGDYTIYDIEDGSLWEVSAACAEAPEGLQEVCQAVPAGRITKAKHSSGIDYYFLDRKDENLEDEIYFMDKKGAGYKIFVSPYRETTIHMLNKAAAEVVYSSI